MDGRDALPRCRAHSLYPGIQLSFACYNSASVVGVHVPILHPKINVTAKEPEPSLQSLRVRLERQQLSYDIRIGRDLRGKVGQLIRSVAGERARRVAVISNKRVFDLYGAGVINNLIERGFAAPHWLMPNGERFKNIQSLERILNFLVTAKLERDDFVLALGGGVVGDVAGFAAATYMRGIGLVQMPTSLLAQIDSSVGGKTGINLREGKNLVGSFHQPSSVLIDTQTLTTLPSRELVSGFCEAVKQGAVSGRKLFEQTTDLLTAYRSDRETLLSKKMEQLISAQCAFKASIVMNDEREATKRSDSRSRRILNFGHTTGHALEAVTSYRRFRHGEAVGHGMLVAGEISKNLGLLDATELESLRDAVRLCGRLPDAGDIDEKAIVQAIARDKKSQAGEIKWVLLEGIGRPRIIDGKEISQQLLRDSIRKGLGKRRN